MRVLVLAVVLVGCVAAAAASVVRDVIRKESLGSDLSAISTANVSYEVKKIVDPVVAGEGPHWDHRVQALYFIDLAESTIHKYVPTTGVHTKSASLSGRPAFVVPVEGTLDQFLVGILRQFVVVQWDGAEGSEAKVIRIIGEVDQHLPDNELNDGKADPRGRVFSGSMGPAETPEEVMRERTGSIFRVDGGGITQVTEDSDKIGLANGLAFDLKLNVMYYIDSIERKLRRYDYDVETGEISNMQYFFDFLENGLEGSADGSTIDTEGNLWVAVVGDSCVIQVSPQGELLRKVLIPAVQVSSCTFGGPNFDILFVTTLNVPTETLPEGDSSPDAGATFAVTGLGVKGYPNVNFKF